MAGGWDFTWHGPKVKSDIERATRNGIDETLAACVNHAKPNTPVDTSTLQGSIRFEPAKKEGGRIVGRWGSFDVNYAIFIEMGARGRPGRYMLRRAADAEYPSLADRIQRRLS